MLFSLCQYKVKKENKDYYFWLYLYYPEEKAFIVHCEKEGIVSKDSPSNYYESFGEKNTIFNLYGNYFRERLKINKRIETNSTINLREYHKLKLANKPIPNALKPQNHKDQDDYGITDKIIPISGTGATRKLKKGSEAIVQRGVKIVIYHYVSPSGFSEPEEIYLPKDYDLEKTVVDIGQEFSENIYSTSGLQLPGNKNEILRSASL